MRRRVSFTAPLHSTPNEHTSIHYHRANGTTKFSRRQKCKCKTPRHSCRCSRPNPFWIPENQSQKDRMWERYSRQRFPITTRNKEYLSDELFVNGPVKSTARLSDTSSVVDLLGTRRL